MLPRTPPRWSPRTIGSIDVRPGYLTPAPPVCHCAAEPVMMLRFVLPNAIWSTSHDLPQRGPPQNMVVSER